MKLFKSVVKINFKFILFYVIIGVVINFLNSKISKSVNSKNAYRLFKEHCEERKLSHEDILKSLKRTSKYYGAFMGENKCYSNEVSGYLNAFCTIKQTTILPLLFRIFDDYASRENERIVNFTEIISSHAKKIAKEGGFSTD